MLKPKNINLSVLVFLILTSCSPKPIQATQTVALASTLSPTITASTLTPVGNLYDSGSEKCSLPNPNYQVNIPITPETVNYAEIVKIVQRELSRGGAPLQISNELNRALKTSNRFPVGDLTGDGILEIIVPQVFNTVIIGCKGKEYEVILDYNLSNNGGRGSPMTFIVGDLNMNGIPEIVVQGEITSGANSVFDVLEWNGSQFTTLLQMDSNDKDYSLMSMATKSLYWYGTPWLNLSQERYMIHMNGPAAITIKDVNNDSSKEIVLTDNGPVHPDTLYNFGPWRGKQITLKWDGKYYRYYSLNMDPPVYRFQAVQEADRLFLIEDFENALEFYNEVASNKDLDWWSAEKMESIRFLHQKVVFPTPQPDKNEYYSLTAYSMYRTMLIYLAQNQVNDAQTEYASLIENFSGNAGKQYAELATIYWNEYQRTQSLELSCLPVINYTETHPEILDPLGSDYHGAQSHFYVAEDVCPFK